LAGTPISSEFKKKKTKKKKKKKIEKKKKKKTLALDAIKIFIGLSLN